MLWCHWGSNTPLLSPQGTTVRMITAVDQDKGRPRGIGYTIVSGESWWDVARGHQQENTTIYSLDTSWWLPLRPGGPSQEVWALILGGNPCSKPWWQCLLAGGCGNNFPDRSRRAWPLRMLF